MSSGLTPEEAEAQAIRRARERIVAGGYAGVAELEALRDAPQSAIGRLHEWSLIEIDLEGVRSTRPLGRPITAAKRGLARMLRQYHGELEAQVSRFNVALLVYAGALEDRIEQLERRLDELESPPPPS
ncbi:MAG: hypothetical protein ACR2NH_05235 [Solirubrobacteraceae bacterium]